MSNVINGEMVVDKVLEIWQRNEVQADHAAPQI
jgi:hypothetical protein